MNDKTKGIIYLLGVGHGTPMFIELAEDCGYSIGGLYHYNDDRTGDVEHGYKILGSFDDLCRQKLHGKNFCLTMGDMTIKEAVSNRILNKGGLLPTLVHPSSSISRFASVSSNGVLICRGCEVNNDVVIDDGCVLWPHAMIDHDSHLGAYTFMGPKSYVGAYTLVESRAFIGQCSVLISGKAKYIGKESLVGAGSVVTKPVPDKTIIAGNPARILKHKL